MRLGHPSRVSDTLLHHTLEGQIMDHSSYKELKNVRRQAEEYRGLANKYKRHFGWQEREQRRLLISESKKLRAEAELLERYITDQLLETTQVICCTLVGANSRLLSDKHFSTVFIDEAAQALEPGCWIPIRRAEKVVFAGDHRQLPPTIKSIDAERGGLGKTLMEKCIERQPVAIMLETQYRMNEQIMAFSSEQFYNNRLEAHESVKHNLLPELLSDKITNQAVEFIDTAGCGFQESAEAEGSSTANPEEAELVLKHLRALLAALPEPETDQEEAAQPIRIGVISPYRAQINYLKEQVESDAQLMALKTSRTLHLGTVDSFQGQERDLIYISLVRSNVKGEIGFLQDFRRMNVALTRARKKLVIVGDSATIGAHPFYQAFLEYIDRIGAYRSAWDFNG
jgi:ATP-dependent RNA/DNA helicase IGHMBP2